MNSDRLRPAAEEAAEPPNTSADTRDISGWYSQDETLKILGIGQRSLNERIQKGRNAPERAYWKVPRTDGDGVYDVPCYNPDDVNRLAPKQPQTAVFPASSTVGVATTQQHQRDGEGDARAFVLACMEGMARLAERIQLPRDRYLTVERAAIRLGVSTAMIRRLIRKGHLEVMRDGVVRVLCSSLDAVPKAVISSYQDPPRQRRARVTAEPPTASAATPSGRDKQEPAEPPTASAIPIAEAFGWPIPVDLPETHRT